MTATRRRPVLIAALALAAGCERSAAPEAGPGDRLSVVTAGSIGILAHEAFSGYRVAVRLVVSDPAAFAAAWRQVYTFAEPQPDVPAVDFSTGMVLVAAAGERTSGDADIRIDSIVVREAGAEVHVTVRLAGATCLTTAALSQPVMLALVPAQPVPVHFVERRLVEECE